MTAGASGSAALPGAGDDPRTRILRHVRKPHRRSLKPLRFLPISIAAVLLAGGAAWSAYLLERLRPAGLGLAVLGGVLVLVLLAYMATGRKEKGVWVRFGLYGAATAVCAASIWMEIVGPVRAAPSLPVLAAWLTHLGGYELASVALAPAGFAIAFVLWFEILVNSLKHLWSDDRRRRELGRRALLIDPFGVVRGHREQFPEIGATEAESASYNPLDFIRQDDSLAVRDINVLLDALLTPPRSDAHNISRHFYESARAIIAGYMAWVRFREPHPLVIRKQRAAEGCERRFRTWDATPE